MHRVNGFRFYDGIHIELSIFHKRLCIHHVSDCACRRCVSAICDGFRTGIGCRSSFPRAFVGITEFLISAFLGAGGAGGSLRK